MNPQNKQGINRIFLILSLIIITSYFFFMGIAYSKGILAPLALALVLALLMFPVANKLESIGVKRIFSTIINVLILLGVTFLLSWVLSNQIKNFMQDWEELKKSMIPKIEAFEEFVIEYTPLDKEQLDGYKSEYGLDNGEENEQQEENEKEEDKAENNGEQAFSIAGKIFGFVTDFLITFVYVFLFIQFRGKFKLFILKLFPPDKQEEVREIISKSTYVVQRYLAGRLFLMVVLVILYSVGLFISGMDNVIFISSISAVLSIIPFVGNFMGYGLAMAMGLFSDGDTGTFIGITLTFLIVQFVDTYVLQPIVLGGKLDVHPFFIIFSVILGNALWGIIGMVLAIPIFAIICVICRNVPGLHAFGFLFSNHLEETEKKKSG